jgi:carboxylesterase type B
MAASGRTARICEPLVMDNIRNVVSMFGEQGLSQAQHIADQMSAAWVAFARSGNPNTPARRERPALLRDIARTMTHASPAGVSGRLACGRLVDAGR